MTRMMKAAVFCLIGLVGACAVLPRQKLEAFSYAPFPKTVNLFLGKMDVDHATMQERISKMIPEAAALAAKKNRIAMAAEQAGATVIMDLWVSEKSFNRDLETLNSISISATLRDAESGKIIMKTIYTEETSDTLVSFYHLYDVVDAVCRSLSEKIPAQARTGA
jgi:hypothetical protein